MPIQDIAGEYLSVAQAARLLNVDRRTIYSALEAGQLSGLRIGRQWRIHTTAIAPQPVEIRNQP